MADGPPTKRVRGRNATLLADKNPFDFDDRVTFDEDSHTYTVDGKKLTMSVSSIVKIGFPGGKFDPVLVIRRNLASWRSKPDSKYHDTVRGLSDADARAAIQRLWDGEAEKGTRLHKWAELVANEETPVDIISDMSQEQTQIMTGWAMFSCKGLEIVRTEHSIFYPPTDPWLGGQVDFLMHSDKGYTIVDLKRTDKDLDAQASSYGKTGAGPMSVYKDNDHMRYSLQQSLYGVLLEALTGEVVTDMFLLQVHPSFTHPKLIPCTDLRVEAQMLLNSLPPSLPDFLRQQ